MLVADFQIQFSLQRFDKTSVATPFKIVILTDSKKIESELKITYPQFLYHKILSPDENLKYIEMKNFILKRANQLNLSQQIENYFFDNRWFFPLDKAHVQTKLTKCNSKYWTNKDYPYLEIEGEITLDLARTFNTYYSNKFIEFKVDKQFLSRNTIMKFIKPWPLIVTYQGYDRYRNLLLTYIKENFLKNRNYVINLEKTTGLKNILNADIEFRWRNNDIEIIIQGATYLLSQKVKDNKFKLLAGLYLLNKKRK